ncbi:A-kinase anchor protein 10, mitochondrial [Anoplophora glabripennis]|uniref:A-kinase anchor protein 10, mitochondrial n=1 Tax=Anoplophora glabripennis TaxID=217634 RepID=UPI00087366C4|nr:A-kinase anchor protein 10, mitochondrial [Anoplophora glabripennis]
MLQFWKKSGHDKNRPNFSSTAFSSVDRRSPKQGSLEKENQNCNAKRNDPLPLASFDDEGLFDIGEFESSKERSRLSKTLQEIISDKSALGYFIQYMESRNASPYILCWLDIETFKSDLNHCSESVKKGSNFSPVPNSQTDHDSLSVSTDCDSYTADSNSLCDFSTATLSEVKTPLEFNGCDRDNSDSSIKLKTLSEDISVSEKKNVQNTVNNALVIFKKYIAQEAQHNIKCSEEVRKEVMENICNKERVLSGNCFDLVQACIYEVMENEYFAAFLGTDYFCKHQIDVLTSGNVVLEDILYNETALFYFMEYLEQENQRCLLEFWMAASNLQQQLHDQKEFYDPVEAQNDAVVLYDKYFSLQAHCPLGFSDKVRLAVEQNICGENGLILDCFHLPLKIVEKVLEKNYLKPFLASQLFYKYLSDLINTVQSNGYSTNIERNKHSPSDCSSEKSFGQSTFLALEVPYKQTKKEKTTDMSIDTRELYDPDSLWKRRKNHRLSLGRVSELGKYETDFEPEPDRKEFNLKDVVKKFVSLEEEQKKKEEMAWQVAEMIVKDITSVTLNDHNG